MSVPDEIVAEMNKNRFMAEVEKEWFEKRGKDKWIFKRLVCGCEFGNAMKEFGYSNHYCNEHVPSYPIKQPVRQEV